MASASLERDATTAIGYATLATFGWFIYALGPAIPLLQAELGVSRSVASLHNVAFAVGVVAMGLVAIPVLRRTHRDGGVRLGMAALAAGTLVLVVGSLVLDGAIAVTITGALVAGLGGSLAINAATAILTEHHGDSGAAAVSEGNATASAIGLLAPLAVGAGTALGLTWRAGVVATILPVAVVWLLVRRAPATAATSGGPPPRGDGPDRRLPGAYWLVWVALVGTVMVETGFITWTPDLLVDRLGLTTGSAAASVSGFLAGMAVGRFALGRLALRMPAARLFVAGLVVAAAGWGLLWSTSVTPIAIVGLVVAGLGAAGHFPLGAVLLIEASGGLPDRALARMAVGLGAASGAGPFVLGSLADASTIHAAFLVIPTALVLSLATTVASRRA